MRSYCEVVVVTKNHRILNYFFSIILLFNKMIVELATDAPRTVCDRHRKTVKAFKAISYYIVDYYEREYLKHAQKRLYQYICKCIKKSNNT